MKNNITNSMLSNMINNMTLAELIQMVIPKENLDNTNNVLERDVYYTSKDLYEIYPNIFSKYKLAKYIKYENFPVIKDGKERFFLKSNVEKWLEDKNNQSIFRSI